MKVLLVIPARYASTRLPAKPLVDIGGKPMIQRVWEQGRLAKGVADVVVATDDARIADVVARFGGTAVLTSPGHATGTDRIAEVASGHPADVYVNLQGDLPFAPPSMIEALVGAFGDPSVRMATLAREITAHPEARELDLLLSTGETVSMKHLIRRETLSGFAPQPAYVSPNGDSVKDTVTFAGTWSASTAWRLSVQKSDGALLTTTTGSGTGLSASWAGDDGSATVPDGVYRVVVDATDGGGHVSGPYFFPVTVDMVDPVVKGPASRLISTTMGGSTVPVKTTWSATDGGGGVAYKLQRQVNGGSWSGVSLASTTSAKVKQSLAIGDTYRYRVRATDGAGNTSAYRYGPAFRSLRTQETSSAVTYGGAWTSVTPGSQQYWLQAFNNVLYGRWLKIDAGYGKAVLGYFGRTPLPPDPQVVTANPMACRRILSSVSKLWSSSTTRI